MSNLNGLRQLISLAMRESNKSVTISTEMASMIVVEYEKHRVDAIDAIDDKVQMFSKLESVKRVANDLSAQNALFRKAMKFAATPDMWESNGQYEEMFEYKYDCWYQDLLNKFLDMSPAACPDEIQVEAIEDLIEEFNSNYYGEELSQWLEQQAEKVRNRSRLIETQSAAQRILGQSDGE